jgi:L-asparaginase II
MERWALGLARFAERAAVTGSPENQIYTDFSANPVYTSGTHETSYRILEKYPNLIVKTGAEGVFIACIPSLKASIVVKVRDGNERASKPAMIWALDFLGIKPVGDPLDFKTQNWSGKTVGGLRVLSHEDRRSSN